MQDTPITPVTPPAEPQMSPTPPPKRKKLWLWIAIGVLVLAAAIVGIVIAVSNSNKLPAKDLFYTMVETAAQKTKVHYAQERSTPKKPELPPIQVKSLAEFDFNSKEYSTVFVSEAITAQAARCVKGKEYKSPVSFPDNLAEAETAIKGDWLESRYLLGTCKYQSTRYQGNFTDGILPVGLTAQQAKNMVSALKMADATVITDEGSVTYKDKKGRKISFELGQEKTGKPYKADTFFYAFRDGTTGKVGGNDIKVPDISNYFSSLLSGISPAPGVKGFYVIDEKTNLPIYSEITTTADGIKDYVPTTFLSEYDFPQALTIDAKTPLVEFAKPK